MELDHPLSSRRFPAFALVLVLLLATPLPAQSADTQVRLLFEAVPFEAGAPLAASEVHTRNRAVPAPDLAPASQQPAPLQRLSDIAWYHTLLEADINADGAFAPGLILGQTGLGERYQELQLHESAIKAFGEARHLIRVQEGLAAAEQVPLLEASISSLLELGELSDALKLHASLEHLLLGETHQSSKLELAEAYIRAGDSWQRSADVLRGMEAERRFRIGRSLTNNPGSPARSRRPGIPDNSSAIKATRLMYTPEETSALFSTPALHYYAAAMSLLTEAQVWSHPRLIEFEYHVMREIAARHGPYRPYWGDGKARQQVADAMQRVVGYTAHGKDSTLADLIDRMLDAGDWHLYTVKTAQAHRQYADALALMRQLEVAPDIALTLLNPQVPWEIPTLFPSSHSRIALGIPTDAVLEYDGHIDVAYRINKYGRTSRIEFEGTSTNADSQVLAALLAHLEDARFRPAIGLDGKTDKRDVQLRYYFAVADPDRP